MGPDYVILVYRDNEIVLAKYADHNGNPAQIIPEIKKFINKIRTQELRDKFLSRVKNIKLISNDFTYESHIEVKLEQIESKFNEDIFGIIKSYCLFNKDHPMFDNEIGVYLLNKILEDNEPIEHLFDEYYDKNAYYYDYDSDYYGDCHIYEIDFDDNVVTVNRDYYYEFYDFYENYFHENDLE